MGVVNCSAYAKGVKVGEISLDEISEYISRPDHFVWVGLYEPDQDLLKKMQEEFGLHDLAVEDALRAHQRPKLEHYGDSVFVVLRTVEMTEAHDLDFGETHLFVGPRYLLTVRHGASKSLVTVRGRCEANPHLLGQGAGFALYAVMDFTVDQYFPVIDLLEEDVEQLEERLFNDKFDRLLTERIYVLKRRIIEVKRALLPLVDVCNQLMRFDHTALIPEISRPYFRDVYDHVIRLNEMSDTLRDLLSAALEANLAMVSVAQSEITKQLASYGAIIAVPTMIAGIYGMNFEHMPELKETWGYPAVLILIAAVCSWLYWRFKKSGWL